MMRVSEYGTNLSRHCGRSPTVNPPLSRTTSRTAHAPCAPQRSAACAACAGVSIAPQAAAGGRKGVWKLPATQLLLSWQPVPNG
eukprot:2687020-Prymnesium_polylepis.1